MNIPYSLYILLGNQFYGRYKEECVDFDAFPPPHENLQKKNKTTFLEGLFRRRTKRPTFQSRR